MVQYNDEFYVELPNQIPRGKREVARNRESILNMPLTCLTKIGKLQVLLDGTSKRPLYSANLMAQLCERSFHDVSPTFPQRDSSTAPSFINTPLCFATPVIISFPLRSTKFASLH